MKTYLHRSGDISPKIRKDGNEPILAYEKGRAISFHRSMFNAQEERAFFSGKKDRLSQVIARCCPVTRGTGSPGIGRRRGSGGGFHSTSCATIGGRVLCRRDGREV